MGKSSYGGLGVCPGPRRSCYSPRHPAKRPEPRLLGPRPGPRNRSCSCGAVIARKITAATRAQPTVVAQRWQPSPFWVGYSGGQPPSGIGGAGPSPGPPDTNSGGSYTEGSSTGGSSTGGSATVTGGSASVTGGGGWYCLVVSTGMDRVVSSCLGVGVVVSSCG